MSLDDLNEFNDADNVKKINNITTKLNNKILCLTSAFNLEYNRLEYILNNKNNNGNDDQYSNIFENIQQIILDIKKINGYYLNKQFILNNKICNIKQDKNNIESTMFFKLKLNIEYIKLSEVNYYIHKLTDLHMYSDKKFNDLKNIYFKKYIQTGGSNIYKDYSIANVYSSNCKYSNIFLPKWNVIKDHYIKQFNINVTEFNVVDKPEILKQYGNITGFPSIIFINNKDNTYIEAKSKYSDVEAISNEFIKYVSSNSSNSSNSLKENKN